VGELYLSGRLEDFDGFVRLRFPSYPLFSCMLTTYNIFLILKKGKMGNLKFPAMMVRTLIVSN
jgi:hypothetical protein